MSTGKSSAKLTGTKAQPAQPKPSARLSGRHPDAERTVVRLTDDAVTDLRRLNARDPQIVRWALKKMLLLERNPDAGDPLVGDLVDWRKIAVGDRDWRVVWRVTHDEVGATIVDVAEVWAAGARSDSEVYAEMSARVASMSASPRTNALASVVEQLAGAIGLTPQAEPTAQQPHLPPWLRSSLIEKVGLSDAAVEELDFDDAVATWNAWTARPR